MAAVQYTVTSGLTSLPAATTKVACQLACGTLIAATVFGMDVSFDGDTGVNTSAVIPVRIQLVRVSTASSGGTAYTPFNWNKLFHAAVTTARINDTTGGTLVGTGIIKEWLVSPLAGLSIQFALGREIDVAHSDFLELRLVSQAGMTTCNYVASLDFEE